MIDNIDWHTFGENSANITYFQSKKYVYKSFINSSLMEVRGLFSLPWNWC